MKTIIDLGGEVLSGVFRDSRLGARHPALDRRRCARGRSRQGRARLTAGASDHQDFRASAMREMAAVTRISRPVIVALLSRSSAWILKVISVVLQASTAAVSWSGCSRYVRVCKWRGQ